jgi:FtsP/CotA-like multicopper oxidase with cupredoxin domain
MATSKEKLCETARLNRQEIINAKLSRRDLMKLGLLTSSGFLIAKYGLSARAAGADSTPKSPYTTPWIEELPMLPVKQPSLLDVAPTGPVQSALGEMGRVTHQKWAQFYDPSNVDTYLIDNKPAAYTWHRELPPDDCWAFDGRFPGPRIHARYGRPAIVRFQNNLPSLATHSGYGRPTPTTHLHNGHTASESDGNPLDMINPGTWKDHFYPNVRAGFTDPNYGPGGDVRESMGTLWFHDHCLDFTAQNVYRGQAGFYLLFNEFDSGDENDSNPNAFRLPSGDFDVPLMFHDRSFGPDGKGYYDLFNLDGLIGDKYTVNGKINPFMRVAKRKYRFRNLNIGPSRFLDLYLSNGMNIQQISEDGNLLPGPITTTHVKLTPANRSDVIIDFTNIPSGTEIFLVNCAEQSDGRGPTGKTLPTSQGTKILKFIVDATIDTKGDPSRVPAKFYDLPPINTNEVVAKRTFVFDRSNGAWSVNGKPFDPAVISANPRQGTAEEWTIVNNSGGWMHPVHIHFEEHRILSRNGVAPPSYEAGRKDVIWLDHNEKVKIFMRFRDFLGRYPMHCHNVVHEDHAMMVMWEIVP